MYLHKYGVIYCIYRFVINFGAVNEATFVSAKQLHRILWPFKAGNSWFVNICQLEFFNLNAFKFNFIKIKNIVQ